MNLILELLVNAGVLFLLAAALPSVKIKSYGTAIGVALVGRFKCNHRVAHALAARSYKIWLIVFLL